MRERAARRFRRERHQGRRAVLCGQAAHGRGVEGVAVQRFRRRRVEIGMRHQGAERGAVRRPCARQPAALVARGARLAQHPVVDQRAAGARVEREEVLVRRPADPGDVGDAAEIEHGKRRGEPAPAGERRVKERRERRPLPACGHVVAAEIVHHVDPEAPGQRRAVAELVGAPGVGLVQHRVAGEARDSDLLPAHARFGQQGAGQRGMEAGERLLGLMPPALPLDHGPQPRAQVGRIGRGPPRAECGDRDPVGLDQRGIDAVQRGPAHHPERPHRPAGIVWAHWFGPHLTPALSSPKGRRGKKGGTAFVPPPPGRRGTGGGGIRSASASMNTDHLSVDESVGINGSN